MDAEPEPRPRKTRTLENLYPKKHGYLKTRDTEKSGPRQTWTTENLKNR